MGTTSPLSAAEQQANANLEQLVADVDRGGRNVGGIAGAVLFCGAIAWSLFQLWYASPLPFALNFGILNDTEARAVHLGIAMFLGYLASTARTSSPRVKLPWFDWVFALIAGFCGADLFFFLRELATLPGIPPLMELWVASSGWLDLLEVT